jgi:uncharacterized membrane protein
MKMDFIQTLFSKKINNCDEICWQLCKALNVKVTFSAIKEKLSEHPNYPSLLSISDMMNYLGVANTSVLLNDFKNIFDIGSPFVAQVSKDDNLLFALIYDVHEEYILWYNPFLNKKETIHIFKFKELFTGYVQLYSPDTDSGDKYYKQKRHKENINVFIETIFITLLPLFLLTSGFIAIISNGIESIFPLFYAIFLFLGCIMSYMLVSYDHGKSNPFVDKLCSVAPKANCSAVLNSSASQIFGIHWSMIGFSYFLGTLLVLMSGGICNSSLLGIAAFLNVLALPYIFFSIYYQARVVRHWCVMCLSVQVLLLFLFFISLLGGFFQFRSIYNTVFILPFVIAISSILIFLYIIGRLLDKANIMGYTRQALNGFKYDKTVFRALLSIQRHIEEPDLGITIGNPDGSIHIVKVCNPYCGACKMSHQIIDDLLDSNPDISVRIIFTPSPDDGDVRNKPVKAFLAQANRTKSEEKIREILNCWYLSETQDYDSFIKLYLFSDEELSNQVSNVRLMHEWCNTVDIKFTPTFFIDGYQLPDKYFINDLKYFLC